MALKFFYEKVIRLLASLFVFFFLVLLLMQGSSAFLIQTPEDRYEVVLGENLRYEEWLDDRRGYRGVEAQNYSRCEYKAFGGGFECRSTLVVQNYEREGPKIREYFGSSLFKFR